MKTRWLMLVTLCLLLAGSTIAQNGSIDPLKLTATVPFDFIVNDSTFPQGDYVVRASGDGHRLMIQNKTQPQYSTYVLNNDVPLNPGRAHNVGKMIFLLNNGQHVLHQIQLEGDNHTHDIIHGHDVIELVASR